MVYTVPNLPVYKSTFNDLKSVFGITLYMPLKLTLDHAQQVFLVVLYYAATCIKLPVPQVLRVAVIYRFNCS